MYTSKLKIKTSSLNAWRSLCWWPDLSDCLITNSISQGRPQKKPADHNCWNNGEVHQSTIWRRPPSSFHPVFNEARFVGGWLLVAHCPANWTHWYLWIVTCSISVLQKWPFKKIVFTWVLVKQLNWILVMNVQVNLYGNSKPFFNWGQHFCMRCI